MSILFRIRRGLRANLPTLAEGEPGFTTDEKKLYIGTSSGNIELSKATDLALKQNIPPLLTLTLLSTGWTNNRQTVTAPGVVVGDGQVGTPIPEDMEAWSDAEIKLLPATEAGKVTFSCGSVPTVGMIVRLMLTEVIPK